MNLNRDTLQTPRTKAETIAQVLRDEIASGTFPVGSRLPAEAELVQRFGVSRPSFREALRILESERLIAVSRGPRGGAIVRMPDLDPISRSIGVLLELQGASIQDIFRARALIEPELVRSIALVPAEAPLSALAQCATAQRYAIDDIAAFKREELQFRHLLIEHGRSITLSNLASLLNDVIENKLLALPAIVQSNDTLAELRQGVRAKEKLIGQIEKGDADAAEQAWRAYLDMYATRIVTRMGK